MPLETIPRPDPTPFDEPEVEVLRGIEVPKVSPRRQHALLQGELWLLLRQWAGVQGDAGTEWRMRLSGASENVETSLVPDVAYLASVDAAKLTDEELEEPPLAPTIAVEIRSPGDRSRNVTTKIRMYLAAGSRLVLDVDAARRAIVAHDATGERTYTDGMQFEHEGAPGLTFDITALFNTTKRKRE
jgi:Uma2 family endonuclease